MTSSSHWKSWNIFPVDKEGLLHNAYIICPLGKYYQILDKVKRQQQQVISPICQTQGDVVDTRMTHYYFNFVDTWTTHHCFFSPAEWMVDYISPLCITAV